MLCVGCGFDMPVIITPNSNGSGDKLTTLRQSQRQQDAKQWGNNGRHMYRWIQRCECVLPYPAPAKLWPDLEPPRLYSFASPLRSQQKSRRFPPLELNTTDNSGMHRTEKALAILAGNWCNASCSEEVLWRLGAFPPD